MRIIVSFDYIKNNISDSWQLRIFYFVYIICTENIVLSSFFTPGRRIQLFAGEGDKNL